MRLAPLSVLKNSPPNAYPLACFRAARAFNLVLGVFCEGQRLTYVCRGLTYDERGFNLVHADGTANYPRPGALRYVYEV